MLQQVFSCLNLKLTALLCSQVREIGFNKKLVIFPGTLNAAGFIRLAFRERKILGADPLHPVNPAVPKLLVISVVCHCRAGIECNCPEAWLRAL